MLAHLKTPCIWLLYDSYMTALWLIDDWYLTDADAVSRNTRVTHFGAYPFTLKCLTLKCLQSIPTFSTMNIDSDKSNASLIIMRVGKPASYTDRPHQLRTDWKETYCPAFIQIFIIRYPDRFLDLIAKCRQIMVWDLSSCFTFHISLKWVLMEANCEKLPSSDLAMMIIAQMWTNGKQ